MKVDRKPKAEKSPPAVKTVKGGRRAAPKTNGKHPLAAYEHIPIGIVEASLDGKYMDVNEEFCRILGYSRQELLRLGIKDCTHEDDYSIDSKLYEQLIAGKIPFYRLEKRYLRKDGRDIWVELTRTLVSDAKGKARHTVGVVLDISDRKDVERVLRDSVERLRLATGAAQMFMWEWDFQNQSYILADNFEEVIGFSGGLLPKNKFETLWALSPEEDVQHISQEFEKAIEHQSDLHALPYRVINPENGQIVWLEISAKIVYDRAGTPERMFGVAQNITESRKTLDEIAIISRMPAENPNPVMRLTPDGNVLYANPASTPLLEAWVQQTNHIIPQELQRSVEAVFSSNLKKEVEIENNGRTFSCTLSPVHEAGYVNLYANDITARKKAEETLMEFARQQEALYQLSDQLHRTASLQDVCDAALDAILNALQCDRASILLFDNQNMMRFVAWRGLSDAYRKATDGHSPWKPDTKDPQPIHMDDVHMADLDDSLRAVIQREGIGALAFIPLVLNEKLIGKFMIYYDAPHVFDEAELDFSLTIAHQLAFGIDRKRTEEALERERELLERLFETMPVMVSIYDPVTNLPQFNSQFEKLIGWKMEEVTLLSLMEACYPDPEYRKHVAQRLDACAQGEWIDVRMQTRDGHTLDTTWSNIRFSNGMNVGIGIDITERKQAEKRVGLLAEISEILRNVEDQYELMYTISKAVGEHLHVKRALFNEIDLEHDREIVHRDYHDGVESVAGVHKVSDYSSITSAEVASGKTVINMDSKTDPRTAQDYEKTYALSGERSYVAVPMMRENRWVASFWVSDDTPRNWSRDEVSLLETVAERTWTVIEKLRINAELRESEERYRFIVENTSDGIWWIELTDPMPISLPEDEQIEWYYKHAVIRQCNLGLARMYGYDSVEEVTGLPMRMVMPRENPQNLELLREFIRAGYRLVDSESRELASNGRELVFLNNMIGIVEDGKLKGEWGTNRDITQRKRAEEALRGSEERYRGIVNQTIGGIAETDLTGRFTMVNDRYCQITGYTREKLLNEMRMQDLTHPDDVSKNLELFGRLTVYGASFEMEKRYVRPDGSIVWVHNSVSAITGADGRPQSAVAAVIDVTERKRAEEALRASESLYRTIARSIPGGGVYVIDKDFRYLVAEGPVAEAFGFSREMLEGHTVLEVFPPETGQRMIDRLQRNFAGETVSFETTHNGHFYWTQQAPLLDSIGHAIVVTLDITERKRAEESLRASELRYRNLFDLVPVAVYSCDADGWIQEYNHRAVELWGRAPLQNDPKVKYCGSYKIFYPDGRFMPHAECPMARVLRGETLQPHEFEILVEREDGRRRTVIAHPLLLQNEQGKITGAINCLYDITERKRAEEALRQSEERFAHFMEHLPGLAWIKDIDGHYVYANAAAEKAFNTPRQELYGKTDDDIFPPEAAAQFRRNDVQALTDEKGMQIIETLEHADGVLHFSLVSKFPIPGPDGSTTLIGGTAFDITERLQAEEALRESEERFRALLRQATAGIVRKDAEGRLIFVNQAFCNMLGYTESDLIGKTVWEFMHPDDIAENRQSYDRLMLEGIPFKLERRFIRRDGSVIWVDASVSPIMDAEGKPQSAVAVEVDITGRKHAEESLQQLNLQLEDRVLSRTARLRAVNQTLREEISERQRVEEALRQSEALARANEEKLSTLFELLPVGISFLDPEGQIIQMNPALVNILKLSNEQLSDQSYRSRKYIRANGTWMPPTEFASQRAVTEGKTVYNVETGVLLEDSEVVWTSESAAPVDVADVGAVVVTVDITESKRAEQALQESRERLQILSQRLVEVQEEERRAIARELHDRVGQTLAALNINLIIISGQLGDKLDEQISTRLNDSMKLVAETISLVRDVMSNLRPSVLDDYGLEAAIESHLSQYTARYDIHAKFEKPASPLLRLGPSIEMTFLRIAQEALMNIAKHARASQVTLLLQNEENAVRMIIQDNGIGIESWQTNQSGSHGLTIMREHAEAFGGSLKVSSIPSKGTRVEVRIPIENNNPPQVQKEISQ